MAADAGGDRDDRDALMCPPEQKAELEVRNGFLQLEYITHLVVERKTKTLQESHILELQSIAVRDIYPCAGRYTTAFSKRSIDGSLHTPPHVSMIRSYVLECVERVNEDLANGRHEIECAAYAMWRINWIHPFNGGNGRTSRMVAYLIVCMAMGKMLPGVPSFPGMIEERGNEYTAVLRQADADLKAKIAAGFELPDADISAVVAFLEPLLERQLEAAVREGESAG